MSAWPRHRPSRMTRFTSGPPVTSMRLRRKGNKLSRCLFRSATGGAMSTRCCFFITATALVVAGCRPATPAGSAQTGGPVLTVTASYPGASAQVVADTVATPIEQEVNGVEGMVRIESESGNDGGYTAHLYFEPATDPAVASVIVQNRVAMAAPLLPEVVR